MNIPKLTTSFALITGLLFTSIPATGFAWKYCLSFPEGWKTTPEMQWEFDFHNAEYAKIHSFKNREDLNAFLNRFPLYRTALNRHYPASGVMVADAWGEVYGRSRDHARMREYPLNRWDGRDKSRVCLESRLLEDQGFFGNIKRIRAIIQYSHRNYIECSWRTGPNDLTVYPYVSRRICTDRAFPGWK